MLSSWLCVSFSLAALQCLMSGVFRACWTEGKAGARQGILPDLGFVSGKQQGL